MSSIWKTVSIAVLALLLTSAPALARGGHVQSTGSGVCWVTPNPVPTGTLVQLSVYGSGFQPGMMLTLIGTDGAVLFAGVDAAGNFATWRWSSFLPSGVGTYTYSVYPMYAKRPPVLAACSYTVS